jgi:hypothetical protein
MKSRSLGMAAKQVTVPGPDDNKKEPTRKNDVWGTRKSKTLWRTRSAVMTLLTAKSRSLAPKGGARDDSAGYKGKERFFSRQTPNPFRMTEGCVRKRTPD